jgi:hypothetical protein
MDQNDLPLDPRHLEVPSGMPKTIFEPIACSAQTMHLFGVEINTFSKQTEASFHFTYVTWSSMGCDQKHFHARGIFGANRAPILCRE